MTRIIIEINGGLFTCVTSDQPVEYILVDWDNIKDSDPFPDMEDFQSADYITDDIEKALTGLRINHILIDTEDDTSKVDI